MNKITYSLKRTAIVSSFCAILLAVLWYLDFGTVNGEWSFSINAFSFDGMTAFAVFDRVMALLIALAFFACVLFFTELNPRWMVVALMFPIVYQAAWFVYGITLQQNYLVQNPVSFVLPFLALIGYVLTVEGMLPTKWIFVGFCGAAALLPIVLTLCGVGEFAYSQEIWLNPETYAYESLTVCYWSEVLSVSLYYVGLGAFAAQLSPSRPEEIPSEEETPLVEESPRAETEEPV